MTRGPIVVIGDVLLDIDIDGDADRIAPDAPVPVVVESGRHQRPGGAGLAALLAAADGADVTLVTAIGDDPAGDVLRKLLAGRVRLAALPLRGRTASKTRVRAKGQTLVRVDDGDGRAGPGRIPHDVLRDAAVVLVSDYGRGVADLARPLLHGLEIPVVWDPHPNGGAPPYGCALVTPNAAEARLLCDAAETPGEAAVRLARSCHAEAVAVTLGDDGATVARGTGEHVRVPAPEVAAGRDSCGAGDRFAVAAALALRDGATPEEAVAVAVREAGRFVAAGGAAAIRVKAAPDHPRTPREAAEAVRASGGRLIATGGCFDLLHAGHVSLLRRARALGDALIVCVNSDRSVRRLKGPGRPVVREADRVAVLNALGCVDAVVVFDEDDPSALIDRLRPHVWVKGGDYAAADLPETEVMRRIGGEVVILPTLPGHSTTGLITAARAIA
ncbi:D-glycero-beta-D-manno-heptose 1-phosphate adenylyltransferase [Spongiactinospora gelatinilytica]|uniref:D-glycero-beta-D-manno-heptose 1-phosphate adenylyltransferase n=1 Tax=Spongiactinospora gelatinilytica TaxID=2666298 RepID=A0A2W2H984_9ACTN|nr:D-glycero-beta-D-manno-heptose 1-phosphate adenylyltransferase [Spongiactinospora gelatinilytica]PZG57102.1 D-glycero-beta-D-manno-heptose 1-phosphate adenylyltransferase [Spongiactinospora gelatinilytica]